MAYSVISAERGIFLAAGIASWIVAFRRIKLSELMPKSKIDAFALISGAGIGSSSARMPCTFLSVAVATQRCLDSR
jgi:hypothetical protein